MKPGLETTIQGLDFECFSAAYHVAFFVEFDVGVNTYIFSISLRSVRGLDTSTYPAASSSAMSKILLESTISLSLRQSW